MSSAKNYQLHSTKNIWIFINAFKKNDQNGDYYGWKDANLIGIANIMQGF